MRDIGITELEALGHFNLAPLSVRRDIAMLGIIYRSTLNDAGPPQFATYFYLEPARDTGHATRLTDARHSRQLKEHRTTDSSELLKRSIFGLTAVYNLLPEEAVQFDTVKDFQGYLQELVLIRAISGCNDWQDTLSPRVPLRHHPLR